MVIPSLRASIAVQNANTLRRLKKVAGLTVLDLTPAAESLAADVLQSGLLPATADGDAAHITLATAHGMDILLTWNCRHIANQIHRRTRRRRRSRAENRHGKKVEGVRGKWRGGSREGVSLVGARLGHENRLIALAAATLAAVIPRHINFKNALRSEMATLNVYPVNLTHLPKVLVGSERPSKNVRGKNAYELISSKFIHQFQNAFTDFE
ncbi:MAG: hypothetical protein ABIR24_06350 [Verrucomicrobiota bacterium]